MQIKYTEIFHVMNQLSVRWFTLVSHQFDVLSLGKYKLVDVWMEDV